MLTINKLRFWLNSVLGIPSFSDHVAAPSVERMREVSFKSLGLLFDLIHSRQDVEVVVGTSYRWNQLRADHILVSDRPENKVGSLIPLHDCIKLIPDPK